MISFLSRFVGLWFVAGGLVALVVDAAKTIAASALTVTPFGVAWSNLSPATLASVQTFVQQKLEPHVGHWLWNPLIQMILLLPTWLLLGAFGLFLAYLGRRRRLKTAYA